MLTVRLDTKTENRLNRLALDTHRKKSFYVRKAIEDFLNEYEDALRILSIKERLDKGEENTYSLEEVQKMFILKS